MAKTFSLNELAELVSGEVTGNGALQVSGLNGIELAGPDEITFITSAKSVDKLAETNAAACIVPKDVEAQELPCIQVQNPDYAAAVIHNHLLAVPFEATGIHQTVQMGNDCQVDSEVSIGPHVCIGNRVKIGARVVIHPGVVIGDDSMIGNDTKLFPNVTIAHDTIIGARVILHAGVVIGSDGFGYATDPATGIHEKKPQVGKVQIDDDVEIGANSCVDRAAFGTTRIRKGTKIDNLVMVAHNVDIGENTILVAQVGIAGSTTLGRNVVIGGQAGIAGHIHIGDRVMAAARSGIHSNLKEGSVVGGAPAFEIKKWGKATATFARLPEMHKDIRSLRKEVERLKTLLEKEYKTGERKGEED